MLSFLRFRCWFSFLIFSALALDASASCSVSLRWGVDPPFFTYDPYDRTVSGLDYELASEALKRLDCQLILSQEPWARGLVSLREGNVDMVSSAYRTNDRVEFAYFAEETALVSPNVLFFRKGEFPGWNISDVQDIEYQDFRVGSQIGIKYGTEVDALLFRLLKSDRSILMSRRESLWQMLELKRIDGVIADLVTGLYEASRTRGLSLIDKNVVIVSSKPAYFAFSKRSITPEFVKRFNAVFRELKSDGTHQRIVSKYLCSKGFHAVAYDKGKPAKLDWLCSRDVPF